MTLQGINESRHSVLEPELALLQCKAWKLGSMVRLKVLLGKDLATFAPSLTQGGIPGLENGSCLSHAFQHAKPHNQQFFNIIRASVVCA